MCASGGVTYLVFTRMPGESYRRRLRSLLCSGDVFSSDDYLPCLLISILFTLRKFAHVLCCPIKISVLSKLLCVCEKFHLSLFISDASEKVLLHVIVMLTLFQALHRSTT